MKNKEPGIIKQVISIWYEQAKRRRALRQLAKAEWSLDFLSEVLVHSAKVLNRDIIIELETKQGHKMKLSSVLSKSKLSTDTDIFNHLDDEAMVQQFIREYGKK
jgi:hypothetical protein